MKIPLLTKIANSQIKQSFKPDCQANILEETGLGVALARHCQKRNLSVLQIFRAALNDINLPTARIWPTEK